MPPPEVVAKLETIESKLREIDPIFRDFCARYGFNLRPRVELHPGRTLWNREEIDRTIDLVIDLNVSEIIERGFYRDMPWSLFATASLLPACRSPIRILTSRILHGLPFSQLRGDLALRLEQGYTFLKSLTPEIVNSQGEEYGKSA